MSQMQISFMQTYRKIAEKLFHPMHYDGEENSQISKRTSNRPIEFFKMWSPNTFQLIMSIIPLDWFFEDDLVTEIYDL